MFLSLAFQELFPTTPHPRHFSVTGHVITIAFHFSVAFGDLEVPYKQQ